MADKKELLIELIKDYGFKRESLGAWHVLGKCDFDPINHEKEREKEAADIFAKIEALIYTGTLETLE